MVEGNQFSIYIDKSYIDKGSAFTLLLLSKIVYLRFILSCCFFCYGWFHLIFYMFHYERCPSVSLCVCLCDWPFLKAKSDDRGSDFADFSWCLFLCELLLPLRSYQNPWKAAVCTRRTEGKKKEDTEVPSCCSTPASTGLRHMTLRFSERNPARKSPLVGHSSRNKAGQVYILGR